MGTCLIPMQSRKLQHAKKKIKFKKQKIAFTTVFGLTVVSKNPITLAVKVLILFTEPGGLHECV